MISALFLILLEQFLDLAPFAAEHTAVDSHDCFLSAERFWACNHFINTLNPGNMDVIITISSLDVFYNGKANWYNILHEGDGAA
jgi:hypothetical protein